MELNELINCMELTNEWSMKKKNLMEVYITPVIRTMYETYLSNLPDSNGSIITVAGGVYRGVFDELLEVWWIIELFQWDMKALIVFIYCGRLFEFGVDSASESVE